MNFKKVIVLIMTIGMMAMASFGQIPNIKISTMRAIGHTNTVIPSVFTAGDTVAVKYYLQNDSAYPAEAFNVGLRVGGVIVARNAHPLLASGGSDHGEFIWTATCGSPVAVVADCDGTVTENNESDNVMTDPDLACTQPNLMFLHRDKLQQRYHHGQGRSAL